MLSIRGFGSFVNSSCQFSLAFLNNIFPLDKSELSKMLFLFRGYVFI